jgi:uncharacterized protein (DUF885 family)
MKHAAVAIALAAVLPLASLASCASSPPGAPPRAAPAPPTAAAGTGTGAPANADDDAIAKAEQDFVDLIVATSPEQASFLGLHARDADLDDYTLAGEADWMKRDDAMLASLRARFAHPQASLDKRVDLELVEHALALELRVARERHPLEREPSAYLHPLGTLFAMIARDYAPAPERARAVVSRLEKIPAAIAAARTQLKSPPKVWTQVAIESAKQAGPFLDEVHKFLEATSPGDARAAKAEAAARAAFAEYAAFLAKEVLPRSDGEFATGRALFDFMLHEGYFLDEDADGVEALGRRLLDETDAQMTAVARRIDPKAKGWPEVLARLKTNHPSAADLIPSYEREVARARAFLAQKDAVAFPPNDDCRVLETPSFQRNTITAAYDPPPPFDTKQTRGFFFVTPVDSSLDAREKDGLLRENNHADAVDTVVHETYPGHHLQLSFARLHPSLARKALGTSLFEEGWGLYAEEVMNELGYYDDEERLGQLQWTLVRAARVIIDVGLHTKGMSFDDAVAILTQRAHLEPVLAINEVKRYTESPTQPLSYLVGREKIFALRERMRKRDGAAFSLKHFHEEVLSHGSIPPGLMAEEMFPSP